MTAYRPPRHPGSSARPRHLILGPRAADDRDDGPWAGLPAGPEEIRELRLPFAHNPLLAPSADLHTWEQRSCGGQRPGLRSPDGRLGTARLARGSHAAPSPSRQLRLAEISGLTWIAGRS